MTPENELALIVAFYLSKFDQVAVEQLGYLSRREAFGKIGARLGVKANTVKNMRDQFDPLFSTRAGWYQRPLPPSRQRVVDAFNSLSEQALRSFVSDALTSPKFSSTDAAAEIHHTLSGPLEGGQMTGREFSPRGITGAKAENFFLDEFKAGKTPFAGELFDAREYGAGFDFKVSRSIVSSFIEVKGIAAASGSIVFTDKEWEQASVKKDQYHAAVVCSLGGVRPVIAYVCDPAKVFKPKRYTATSISVAWQIPASQVTSVFRARTS